MIYVLCHVHDCPGNGLLYVASEDNRSNQHVQHDAVRPGDRVMTDGRCYTIPNGTNGDCIAVCCDLHHMPPVRRKSR